MPSFKELLKEKFKILFRGQLLRHCLSHGSGKGPDSICSRILNGKSYKGKCQRLQVSGNWQYSAIIYPLCILVSHVNGREHSLPTSYLSEAVKNGIEWQRQALVISAVFFQWKNISLWKLFNMKTPETLMSPIILLQYHLYFCCTWHFSFSLWSTLKQTSNFMSFHHWFT